MAGLPGTGRRWRIDLGPLVVAALALGLRLPHLVDRSLWYDEASSWQTVSFAFPDLIRSNRLNVHMPLYYLLLKLWFALFGDSVPALRGFSTAGGVATVLLADRFARAVYLNSRLVDEADWDPAVEQRQARRFGLVVAGLVAFSPFMVLASIEARMYTLGSALATWVGWSLVGLLTNRRSNRDWTIFGLACVLLTYTHNYGLFSVASAFAILTGFGLWNLGAMRSGQLLGRTLITAGLVGVLYLPGLSILAGQVDRVRQDYWIGPLTLDELARTFAEFALPLPEDRAPRPIGWLPAVGFGVACVLVAYRGRLGERVVLGLALGPMAMAAVLSLWTPVWVPRYFRIAFPAMLTVIALAVWQASLGRPRLRVGLVAGLVGGLLILYIPFWTAMDLSHNPGPHAIAARIEAHHEPGELVVVQDLHQYFVLKYYLRQSDVTLRLIQSPFEPFWGPHLIRPTDLVPATALAAVPAGRSCWIVGRTAEPVGLDLPVGAVVAERFDATYHLHLHHHVYATRYAVPPRKDRP